jgi:hypothetical protein
MRANHTMAKGATITNRRPSLPSLCHHAMCLTMALDLDPVKVPGLGPHSVATPEDA